jgi:hypothetical protein
MERASVVCFRRPSRALPRVKSLAMAPLLLAVALVATGCQDEGTKAQHAAKASCDKLLSTRAKAAMLRVAGIPASAETEFLGDPQRTVDQLAEQYLKGKADSQDFTLCGAYKRSSGLDSVRVQFSLAHELPEKGKSASFFKEYRMGKAALAGTKVAVLYFECTSAQFSGTNQLVRGEVRSRYEVDEPSTAAREDNLRIVHDSSRALSGLLKCKAGSGVTDSFKMPPAA